MTKLPITNTHLEQPRLNTYPTQVFQAQKPISEHHHDQIYVRCDHSEDTTAKHKWCFSGDLINLLNDTIWKL